MARTASALEAVDDRIHEAGGTSTIAPLDLTDGESIAKLAAAVAERWEALDILILNAAMLGSLTPVEHIDAKEYARILGLNLIANQAVIAMFDPLLRQSERAEVVALTSSVGSEPRAFWGAYGSSKAALETLLGAYADETEHSGRIRVHIVDRERPAPECGSSLSRRGARERQAAGSRRPRRSSNGCCPTRKQARRSALKPSRGRRGRAAARVSSGWRSISRRE